MSWLKRVWLPAVLLLSLFLTRPALATPLQFSTVVVRSIIQNPTDVITPPPTTTTGSTQTITGSSKPSTTIQIVNNDKVVAQTTTKQDGSFSVPVPLEIGRNRIAIKGSDGTYSASSTITRTPAWWQHWGKTITTVTGSSVMLVVMGLIIKLLIGGSTAAL